MSAQNTIPTTTGERRAAGLAAALALVVIVVANFLPLPWAWYVLGLGAVLLVGVCGWALVLLRRRSSPDPAGPKPSEPSKVGFFDDPTPVPKSKRMRHFLMASPFAAMGVGLVALSTTGLASSVLTVIAIALMLTIPLGWQAPQMIKRLVSRSR